MVLRTVLQASRLVAVPENADLELLLGQITNCCLVSHAVILLELFLNERHMADVPLALRFPNLWYVFFKTYSTLPFNLMTE